MGCCINSCATSPDRLMDMEVSKELNGDKDRAAKIQKLLFLGSGGSGKSTFFKQLRCIHGVGFTDKDRRVFKEHISAQIIEQINRSVECIDYFNERLPHDFEPLQLSKEGMFSYYDMCICLVIINTQIRKLYIYMMIYDIMIIIQDKNLPNLWKK